MKNYDLPNPNEIKLFKSERSDTNLYEQILLKNCLQNEQVFYTLKDSGLNESDFYIGIHKKLWSAIEKAATEEGISELTVLEYCKEDKEVVVNTIEDLKKVDDRKADLLLSLKVIKEESLKRTLKGMARFTLENVEQKEGSQVLQQVAEKILNVDTASDIVQLNSTRFMDNFLRNLEKRKSEEFCMGVKSGIKTVDKITGGGFRYGVYSLVVARPGHCKTSFLLSCFYNNILNEEKPVFLSLEMTEEQLGIKLMSIASGIPTSKLEDPRSLNKEEEKKIVEVSEKLRKYEYSIVDFTSGVNVLELGIILNKYASNGFKAAYVDYIQLVKMSNNRDPQTAGEFRSVYKNIREICKRVNSKGQMAVVFAAQAGRSCEDRAIEDRIPDMRDLEWSSSLEQDAALVLGLMDRSQYEKEDNIYANKLLFKVAKNRFKNGKSFMLNFNKGSQHITDITDQDIEILQTTLKRWQKEIAEENSKLKAGN